MQEKNLLINSIHISLNRKNQEEIFASLSKNDFKKIISNFEDQNSKLRRISLILIINLLYSNYALKQKFCKLMDLPLVAGRVAFNTRFYSLSRKSSQHFAVQASKNVPVVLEMLKKPISQAEKTSLLWFINYEASGQNRLRIDVLQKNQLQPSQFYNFLDPLQCMFGFILDAKPSRQKDQPSAPRFSQNQRPDYLKKGKIQYDPHQPKLVNNYFQPQTQNFTQFRHDFPKNNSNPTTMASNSNTLNQSLNVERFSHGRQYYQQPVSYKGNYNQPGLHQKLKTNSTHIYQDSSTIAAKPTSSQIFVNGIKVQRGDDEGCHAKNKSSGIKLISSVTTKHGNRDWGTKGSEDISFNGLHTSAHLYKNSLKSPPPTVYQQNKVSISLGGQKIERGYETLREKKIVQKYPF